MPDPAPSEPKPGPLPDGRAEPSRLNINVPAALAVTSLFTGLWCVLLSGPVVAGEASDWDGLKLNALAILAVLLGLIACLISFVRRKHHDGRPGSRPRASQTHIRRTPLRAIPSENPRSKLRGLLGLR